MIEATGLQKHHGATKALQGVTFCVGHGEILGLLGPNGAGKTTTLRILVGLSRATAGTARVGGFDVQREHRKVREILGYLPEDSPHYPEMRVEDFLRFMAGMKELPRRSIRAAVEQAIEETDLAGFRTRLLGNLSKGMRQRVGIAQAILGDPKVLILDEPTVGLDPTQIGEVRDLVKSMRGRRTVVFSTHILPNVSATCTRVAILNRGRLMAEGPTEDVTRRYAARRLVVLVAGEATKAEGVLRGVLGEDFASVTRDSAGDATTLRASYRGNGDHRAGAIKALVDAGVPLLELYEDRPSLEEVFLAATSGGDGP